MRKKGLLSAVLVFSMMASMGAVNATANPVSKAAEKETTYIVMADTKESLDEIKETCKADFHAAEISTVSDLGENYSEKYTVCKLSASEAKELAENEDVLVEEDKTIKACTGDVCETNTDNPDTEWNMQMVRADESEAVQGNGKIKVAVLDSGVDDFNDMELSGSINLIPGEEEVLPLFWDVTGHGSSVAGIIAAEKNDVGITGIAPEVELYAAKVLDEKNQAPVSRVIEGIYWAIENKVNIINMSFGMKQNSEALHKAIRDAYDAGILLVAAAGNDNHVEYPAAYDEVIAVGSVDTSGNVSEKSAAGEELELAAPGEQICSTGAFEGTLICGGTSMATPHVTGIAAKLWAKDTSVSAEFIRQLLAASANGCGSTDEYGYGLVDLAYANEIYDEFKAGYVEGASLRTNENDIEENEEEILSFEDVDYIEGRWTKNKHEETIVNSSLSASEISIIKSGTVYNDINENTVKAGEHPCWHGGYKGSNYISCYMYVTNMAMEFKTRGNINNVKIPNGISYLDGMEMKGIVSNFSWTDKLATQSGKNKSLFIIGMAIHIATDVYAHSAWGNFDYGWEHLDHEGYNNEVADLTEPKDCYPKVFPNRYKTAKEVAKKCLGTYVSGSTGKVSDFYPSGAYINAGVNWKIKYLYEFAKVHSDSIANSLKKYSC